MRLWRNHRAVPSLRYRSIRRTSPRLLRWRRVRFAPSAVHADVGSLSVAMLIDYHVESELVPRVDLQLAQVAFVQENVAHLLIVFGWCDKTPSFSWIETLDNALHVTIPRVDLQL